MHRQPQSPKKQLRRWEGAGLGPEPYSDGAFPWQWAAPRLNSPPLFMLFGGEAGFPPRDRWPFSHKVLCLDLACSGARQQSSDDTAFGKQLPDAEVVATESTENWLTRQASNQMTREAAQLQLNLPMRGEAKQGTPEIMMGLRNQKKWLGLKIHDTTQFRFNSIQSRAFAHFRPNAPNWINTPWKKKASLLLLIKRIVKFGQLKCKEISL